MSGFKVIGFFIRWLAFAVWGVTVIDIVPLLSQDGFNTLKMFESANTTITFLTALFGLIFFLSKGLVFLFVELPHKRKKQELERDIMAEDLIQKRHDNKGNNKIAKKKQNKLNYGKTVIEEFALFLVA